MAGTQFLWTLSVRIHGYREIDMQYGSRVVLLVSTCNWPQVGKLDGKLKMFVRSSFLSFSFVFS